MADQIQDIMTKQLFTVGKDASVREAARMMMKNKVGDLLVINRDGTLFGIVTDRDVVVRGVASARDLDTMQVSEIASADVRNVTPTTSIDDTVKLMRNHAVRRIPVVRDGIAVGIVTIGDLARAKDPKSALAQISQARPNN